MGISATLDLVKVVALTDLVDFYDVYGTEGAVGGTFNPEVGQDGFMDRADAESAEGVGCEIYINNTLQTMEKHRA